ncbi:MAG TPA: WGxxGxxG family protein [Candidatus Dormibacteraeota bacterium]|nr:WGxxGxxG family protein [Candidatus Dormibacteraeota bacterium]
MKASVTILAVTTLCGTIGLARANGQTTGTSNSSAATPEGTERRDHNWGWIGLIGLAGLAGLGGRRRQSEDVRRLKATGVNVKTV